MRGFTLVEVLVALVVLQVGLVGSLGILFVVVGTMERAWALEVGVASVEAVADSLAVSDSVRDGYSTLPEGDLEWTGSGGDGFRVEFRSIHGDTVRVAGAGTWR